VATPDLFGQALQALEQGRGSDATTLLVRAMKRPGLGRDELTQVRCALAEAWLLQDDIRQATDALGRPPEARERLDPARLSDLWRMHGRLAAARGEPMIPAPSASPTSSSDSVTARSATPRSSAST
jgi:hypothetical protein